MEQGLESHFNDLKQTLIKDVQQQEKDRVQKLENDKKDQEEKNKKLEAQIKKNDLERSEAIKEALDKDRASNKEHFDVYWKLLLKKIEKISLISMVKTKWGGN